MTGYLGCWGDVLDVYRVNDKLCGGLLLGKEANLRLGGRDTSIYKHSNRHKMRPSFFTLRPSLTRVLVTEPREASL